MSLIYCPECGHEISNAAIACPNCGRPINAVPPPDAVIVTPRPRREGFPPWAIIPIGIAGLAFLFFLIYAMSGREEDDLAGSNVNVNVSTRRAANRQFDSDPASGPSTVTTVPPSSTTVTTAPPSSTDVQTVSVPGSQTSVPTKGRVVIDAKVVAARSNTPQAVRNEKFYLLDKDVESILNDAGLEPIDGQTLANSVGMAVMYPKEYGDFYRQALAAIRRHIKYSGTTDGSGKASVANIEPNSYYLFGITKTGGGFAMWSSPVSIQAGENVLNLTPQRITEMDNSSGNLDPRITDELRDTSE